MKQIGPELFDPRKLKKQPEEAKIQIGTTGDIYVPFGDNYICLRTRKEFTWEEAENRR